MIVGTIRAHGLFSTSDMVPGLLYIEPSRRSDEGSASTSRWCFQRYFYFFNFIPT